MAKESIASSYTLQELPHTTDLIHWLSCQDLFPKVFWRSKESSATHAAIGALLQWEEIPDCTAFTSNIRLYGGSCFSEGVSEDPTWNDFPKKRFWLPRYEIIQNAEKTLLFTHSLGIEERGWEQKKERQEQPAFSGLTFKETLPSFEGWERSVKTLLQEMQNTSLRKVVLARKWIGESEGNLPVWNILQNLKNTTQHTTVFAFQFTKGSFFLGATPEMLFSRKGGVIEVDSMAGTRPRGKNKEEDETLGQDLLNHPKDREEFSLVKNTLFETLRPFADRLGWEHAEDILFKNTHVQHLYNRLQVHLKEHMTDAALVQLLHPTPALGGFPKNEAIRWIAQHEPFDRGWYGAPIGVLSSDKASFAVAIRSALFTQNQAHLFSGAGLIPQSCPHKEWEELNQKIAPLLTILRDE